MALHQRRERQFGFRSVYFAIRRVKSFEQLIVRQSPRDAATIKRAHILE
jgi:hypothetical protein